MRRLELKAVLAVLAALLLALFVFFFIVRQVAFSEGFYNLEFARLGISSRTNADERAAQLRTYLAGNESVVLANYTERELLHLADVRALFGLLDQSLLLLGIVLVAALAALLYFARSGLLTALQLAGAVDLAIAVAGIAAIINFERAFISAHYVIFNNPYWQLPESAMLIQLFPMQFFRDAFAVILMATAALGLLMIGTAFVARKVLKSREARAS